MPCFPFCEGGEGGFNRRPAGRLNRDFVTTAIKLLALKLRGLVGESREAFTVPL